MAANPTISTTSSSKPFVVITDSVRHYSDDDLATRNIPENHRFRYLISMYINDVRCFGYAQVEDDQTIQSLSAHPTFGVPGSHPIPEEQQLHCQAFVKAPNKEDEEDPSMRWYDVLVHEGTLVMQGFVSTPRDLAATHLQGSKKRKRDSTEDDEDGAAERFHPARKHLKVTELHHCGACDKNKTVKCFPEPFGEGHNHDYEVCIECWQKWLKAKLQEHLPSHIRCAQCTALRVDADIAVLARPRLLERYLDLAKREILRQQKGYAECPLAKCNSYILTHDHGLIFDCELCKARYCIACAVVWHAGETCEEYQARTQARQAEIEKNEEASSEWLKYTKPCPKCRARIDKDGGCDHMACRCGHVFRWTSIP